MAIEFFGDSGEYELITESLELCKDVEGVCAEIGTRRGMSLKYIIDGVRGYSPNKTVISIDPYGSILYQGREGQVCKLDYDDRMKHECMANVYAYLVENPVYFQFYNMTDAKFFSLFGSGIPVYKNEVGSVEEKYSFVFFDGPHYIDGIIKEMSFFLHRTNIGGTWCFDDTTPDFYDHTVIDKWLLKHGFELVKQGVKKAIYRKVVFV